MEGLEWLTDKKDKLRVMCRQDRNNIILQEQFGKVCDEWISLFSKILSENRIGIIKAFSGNTYFDLDTNQLIKTNELKLRLKSFLNEEFVERISFDL